MNKDFFESSRLRLTLSLTKTVIVLPAYRAMQRSNDASFDFEQEANFWYLTGVNAPDWWLVLDNKNQKSWLIAPDVDDVHHIFDGSMSWGEAKQTSGVDEVLSRAEAEVLLEELAKEHTTVSTLGSDPHAKYYDFVINPAQKELTKYLKKFFPKINDCRDDLAKQRAIKQPVEVSAIKRATDLTINTFKEVKNKLTSLSTEYEVESEFTYAFRKNGAVGHAYSPIVASGKNACTLHYNTNQDKLQEETLLLIDIGARVDGYAADVTRTYAIGSPTQRQIDVHHAVEVAHHKIISLLKPGLAIADYQASVDTIMQDALMSLGLLKSRSDTITYRKYFPHAISHGLGIDVHDSLGRPITFAEGMVLTVEPGIYIPEESIGVRIEDDILITSTGHLNLTGALDTSL